MIDEREGSVRTLRVRGMEVHYYVLCPRKLWWFSHGFEQEHVHGTAGHESVEIGRHLHETAYPDQRHREVLIDDLLRIDLTDSGAVHEIKKSRGARRAAVFQLLYYLYYLKREMGIKTTGVIDYPRERRSQEVSLTPELEAELESILAGVQAVREMRVPPAVPEPLSICRKCAYQDLCWG